MTYGKNRSRKNKSPLERKVEVLQYLADNGTSNATRILYILCTNHRDANKALNDMVKEGLIERDAVPIPVYMSTNTKHVISITVKGAEMLHMMDKLNQMLVTKQRNPIRGGYVRK